MNRILFSVAVILMTLLSSCSKPDNEEQTQETIAVSLTVTPNDDNTAVISAELTSGSFHGAKIIEMMNFEEVTIDLESEIQLTNYVISNGVDITEFPYTNTLTDIRIGQDKFTAIIVYDASGRAVDVAYERWTPLGLPDGWSTENNPGELDEIVW